MPNYHARLGKTKQNMIISMCYLYLHFKISTYLQDTKLWDRGVSHKPALEPGYQQQHRPGPTLNGK